MYPNQKTEAQQTAEFESLYARIAELEQLVKQQQATQQALAASEARFHQIFNHSNDAIFVIHPARDAILDVNQSACCMLGFSREELHS